MMILVDEVVNKEDDGRLSEEVYVRELELRCEEGFVEQRSQICMYVHVGGKLYDVKVPQSRQVSICRQALHISDISRRNWLSSDCIKRAICRVELSFIHAHWHPGIVGSYGTLGAQNSDDMRFVQTNQRYLLIGVLERRRLRREDKV
jgi:hypothetical protein